jgi:hypothetical protein
MSEGYATNNNKPNLELEKDVILSSLVAHERPF